MNSNRYYPPVRSTDWHRSRELLDQSNGKSRSLNHIQKPKEDGHRFKPDLFQDFVNPDVIVSKLLTDEPQNNDRINNRGIKLITVTPIYIVAMHLVYKENQFFGIYDHRFCFYDYGVKEFIGAINRDRFAEAAESVVPQMEKRAPWLFDEREESRREDPVVLLTKSQDFNTAYVVYRDLYPFFSHGLREEFDACLRTSTTSKANVIRFVELNKERIIKEAVASHAYHTLAVLLGATIMDNDDRLKLSQIESSLVTRLNRDQHPTTKHFIVDEFVFQQSFEQLTTLTILRALPNKMAQIKFKYGTLRQRRTNDDKAVAGNKRGFNTDVIGLYEEYYAKLTDKLFPTRHVDVMKMNQLIDADLRYSLYPGVILYMVAHALSMLHQNRFGRQLQRNNFHCVSNQDKTLSFLHSRKFPSHNSSPSSRSSRRSRGSSPNRDDSSSRSVSSREHSPQRPKSPSHLASQVVHNQPEERNNRFERSLLGDRNDMYSPASSRSNSLVITDVTETIQPAPSEPGSGPAENPSIQVGHKRPREAIDNEKSNAKKRKVDHSNLLEDREPSPIPEPEEQPDPGAPILGGIASSVPQTSADAELLELLNSW